MITPAEALERIFAAVPTPAKSVLLPLEKAVGGFLRHDIHAPLQLPPFDNSAMDGYAVRWDAATQADSEQKTFRVLGTVAAGDDPTGQFSRPFEAREAVQILTGAMMPPGADTVIRQEDVEVVSQDRIQVLAWPSKGANVRGAGEEVQRGDLVLKAGDPVNPAAAAVLASLGFAEVEIFQRPCVGTLVTGTELVEPGAELRSGQIYESNSVMLAAAVGELGLEVGFRARCQDDLEKLSSALAEGLAACDVLLISGGVSVGAFDHVKEAATRAGVKTVFWKVAQKPGKPLFFGMTSDPVKLVFGLPGNPASALTCFYEYVRPALKQMMGSTATGPLTLTANASTAFEKRGTLVQFLKGKIGPENSAAILDRQGSHMMSSFAGANCLVVVPAEDSQIRKGDQVQVHLLPQ